MPLDSSRLAEVVDHLSTRPGHETVRALTWELCSAGLEVPSTDIQFEVKVPEVRGRVDAVFGATIFEFKRDLRRESGQAKRQLARYLKDYERREGRRYLGIATDGAEFVAYELRDGKLRQLKTMAPSRHDPRAFLQWLDTATTVRSDLRPEPAVIRQEFGRDSLVYERSLLELRSLWQAAGSVPEAALKHGLWGNHLEFVYGTLIEPEELFLQHTYLTIVAKAMTVQALIPGPVPAGELLQGTQFVGVGLHGAIEVDFFDWLLLVDGGADLVDRIARQLARFRLTEISEDILKAVYESLIDPRQRHYLGEYYTPDWLAAWMTEEAVSEPLATRVLDPACGSGTFLFHAVRRYLDAAEQAGWPLQAALEGCTKHVVGVDVHPVAVLFSRVTYLLAIGPERLAQRTGELYVPVYLGDSLQWDVRSLLQEETVDIAVPGEDRPIRFPGAVAGDPGMLERILGAIHDFCQEAAPTAAFSLRLEQEAALPEADRRILEETYDRLRGLHAEGRNHIWTYIARNLTRPLWLSRAGGRPQVILGNPPWLRFNAMSKRMQTLFREACRARGLWQGGRFATHQDLSAYFFVRAIERYLDPGGRIGFVMPAACLHREQYAGFRHGAFGPRDGPPAASVAFERVWMFGSDVAPLFNVPSAVVFASRSADAVPMPATLTAFHGTLPRRDAALVEARAALSAREEPAGFHLLARPSPYRRLFHQGATLVPRKLVIVQRAPVSGLGQDVRAPTVESRPNPQEKPPWRDLPPLRGRVERTFLRPVLVGESVAPFRVLDTVTGVIPWEDGTLLNEATALQHGHIHLARWLGRAAGLWGRHRRAEMSFAERLDYYGNLRGQFPLPPVRVVYAKAGNWPAAAVVRDPAAVIDHKLYWMAADEAEALYLCAILNSEAVRSKVEKLQSEGQFGPRDFDKVMFRLPIPRFRPEDPLHRDLAHAARRAEAAAAAVPPARGFTRTRAAIREALRDDGQAAEIDALVEALLRSTAG